RVRRLLPVPGWAAGADRRRRRGGGPARRIGAGPLGDRRRDRREPPPLPHRHPPLLPLTAPLLARGAPGHPVRMAWEDSGMAATVLDGGATLAAIKTELRVRVAALAAAGRNPGLGTILVGDDPGSHAYVNGKHRDCAEVGILSIRIDLPATASQAQI